MQPVVYLVNLFSAILGTILTLLPRVNVSLTSAF